LLVATVSTDPSDPSLLDEACWCLATVAAGGYFGIKAVVESGALPQLCRVLRRAVSAAAPGDWVVAALRVIAHVTSSIDGHTTAVVDVGILVVLRGYLAAPSSDDVRREACTIVANVCAGSAVQLCAVIDAGLLPAVVECCCQENVSSTTTGLRIEAGWALANALSQATTDQVCYLMTLGGGPALLAVLPDADNALALTICKALRRSLRVCSTLEVDFSTCIDDGAIPARPRASSASASSVWPAAPGTLRVR
jgi:hypothetical protein